MPLIKFYYVSQEFYQDILKQIKTAEKSIYIEAYIFELFPLTKDLIELLAIAQKKGLEVKVIFDGFGSFAFLNKSTTYLEKMDINFRIFNPLFFPFKKWRNINYIFSFFKFLKIGNRRNHRKLCIIDQKTVFIGSQNWSPNHVISENKLIPWQDIGCRIENENFLDLINSFKQIWQVSQNKYYFRPFNGYVRVKNHNLQANNFKLNFSFLQRYKIYRLLLQKIRSSKSSIIIGSAYFIPKRSFIRALKKAKKRGIQVYIVTSGPTDVLMVKLAAVGLYEKLLKVGIPIYEYNRTHFHSKYFLFDDTSLIVGSYNMNHRSLLHDLEILYEIKDQHKINEFIELTKLDLMNSSLLSLESIKNRPWYVKLISKLLYRIRYIL